jgi:hypothetical protein
VEFSSLHIYLISRNWPSTVAASPYPSPQTPHPPCDLGQPVCGLGVANLGYIHTHYFAIRILVSTHPLAWLLHICSGLLLLLLLPRRVRKYNTAQTLYSSFSRVLCTLPEYVPRLAHSLPAPSPPWVAYQPVICSAYCSERQSITEQSGIIGNGCRLLRRPVPRGQGSEVAQPSLGPVQSSPSPYTSHLPYLPTYMTPLQAQAPPSPPPPRAT